MTHLDINFVRQQFPAFQHDKLRHKIFMENAGGSYMCYQVMHRLERYYTDFKVQPYYPNDISSTAGLHIDNAYVSLSTELNCPANSIYFGPSTSQNTYVLANAMVGWLKPDDEIIVTNQDHEANSGVWRRLSQQGVRIKEWCVDPSTGELHIESLLPLLSKYTKLLTFPHSSNILGQINPVKEIGEIAHQRGIYTIVDGVSYASHGFPDIQDLNADIYLLSLYKIYGPHLGVMMIQKEIASHLSNQSHFFNANVREKCLLPAGPDHAQIAAVNGLSEYFQSLHRHHFKQETVVNHALVKSLITHQEHRILTPLLDYLFNNNKVRIIGPHTLNARTPTVSIIVDGHTPHQLATKLGENNILCGAGHFYSIRLLNAMGIDGNTGVLRLSLVHYNTPQEIDSFIQIFHRIINK